MANELLFFISVYFSRIIQTLLTVC